jgi:hypothetical protein
MTDLFTLEQKIMDCWQVVQDLDLMFSRMCEEQMGTEDAVNVALGLKVLYQHRFDDLFDTFERMIGEGAFTPAPIAKDTQEEWIPPFLRAGGTE